MKNNTKTTKTTKTAPKYMTYPQVKAMTSALFHANFTRGEMTEKIDKITNGGTMKADKKAEWLKAHGSEPASYKQCLAYAMILFNNKMPYQKASDYIASLDKKNGYSRQPQAEAVVKKANETAIKAKPETKGKKTASKKTSQPQA